MLSESAGLGELQKGLRQWEVVGGGGRDGGKAGALYHRPQIRLVATAPGILDVTWLKRYVTCSVLAERDKR